MRRKVVTVYKQFEHKVKLSGESFERNGQYRFLDFQAAAQIIGKDRIFIYGSYNLLYYPENFVSAESVTMVHRPFQEIVDLLELDYSGVDWELCDIQVELLAEPEISQGVEGDSEKILNSLPKVRGRHHLCVKGQLHCTIFEHCLSAENLGGYDIICIASTRWDYIWQRPHHLMKRLSKNNRVIFFNHSFPVGFAEIEEKINNPRLWEKRLSKVNENLWVFSTIHLSTDKNSCLPKGITLKEFNYRLKAEALKYLVKALGFTNPIIITYLGESIKYLTEIPYQMLCYDCIDDFSSFTWSDPDTCSLERELIDHADLIFTTAMELYEKVRKNHNQTFYLPNAVEFEHFQKASVPQTIPQDLQKVTRPIIGFMGAFWEWVDEELVKFIAESRPNWNIVIIGPCQPGMGETLRAMPNIYFLGVKEYATLPQYVSHFDVCLIPFKLNSVTSSANPIKMWEYMATGKPIVSTPIPEVKVLGNLIYIGNGKVEFVQRIEEALKETGRKKSLQRMLKAEGNDWDARVEELLQLIKLYE